MDGNSMTRTTKRTTTRPAKTATPTHHERVDPHAKDADARFSRWRDRADAAYRRMFDGANSDGANATPLVTFDQREDLATLLAKELAGFLLQEQIDADAAARPTSVEQTHCPRCGQPGVVAEKAGEETEMPQREVTTRVGKIVVRRQRWRCAKCRVLFFSARPSAGSEHGGIQSAARASGDASGGEGAVVRGRG